MKINNEYPTVITFYTPTWEYENYAIKMKNDCSRLGVPFYSKQYDSKGEWILNTTIKPHFILETLELLKKPVLWIDADGTLWKQPDYFLNDYKYDFAARRQKNPWRQWHVGTLFFNYTEPSINLVKKWVEYSNANPGTDEGALDLVWKDISTCILSDELPATYFEMFAKHDQIPSPDTVISHRASYCPNKLEAKRRRMEKK